MTTFCIQGDYLMVGESGSGLFAQLLDGELNWKDWDEASEFSSPREARRLVQDAAKKTFEQALAMHAEAAVIDPSSNLNDFIPEWMRDSVERDERRIPCSFDEKSWSTSLYIHEFDTPLDSNVNMERFYVKTDEGWIV